MTPFLLSNLLLLSTLFISGETNLKIVWPVCGAHTPFFAKQSVVAPIPARVPQPDGKQQRW